MMATPQFSENDIKRYLSESAVDFLGFAITQAALGAIEIEEEPDYQDPVEEKIREETKKMIRNILPRKFAKPVPFGAISLKETVARALEETAGIQEIRDEIEKAVIDILLSEVTEIAAETMLTDLLGYEPDYEAIKTLQRKVLPVARQMQTI